MKNTPNQRFVRPAVQGGAPPVYRPQALLVQAKKTFSAPPVYRPGAVTAQPVLPKAHSVQNFPRAAQLPIPGPRAARQSALNRGSIQPMALPGRQNPMVLQRATGMAFPRSVIQCVRQRVQKANYSTWWWNDQMAATWHGHNIPLHACHGTHVGQDQLVGGWTFIDDQGTYAQSGVYGPYSPGMGKHNHVERQLIAAMGNALETEMGRDDGTYTDTALAVIEIHQWLTPCSGAHGCTTYLDNQVDEFNGIFAEIRAGARISAEYKYNGGLSETHPNHPKKGTVTTFADAPQSFNAAPLVLHNNPTGWW